MASIKVKFRPSTIAGKEGTIYYQIIQNRVIRQLKTDYRIFTDEWNSNKECLILSTVDMKRYDYLSRIQQNIEWITEDYSILSRDCHLQTSNLMLILL